MFSRLFGKKSEGGPKTANMGDKNVFYYSDDLGCWVERGKEHLVEKPSAAPPPPPKPTGLALNALSASTTRPTGAFACYAATPGLELTRMPESKNILAGITEPFFGGFDPSKWKGVTVFSPKLTDRAKQDTTSEAQEAYADALSVAEEEECALETANVEAADYIICLSELQDPTVDNLNMAPPTLRGTMLGLAFFTVPITSETSRLFGFKSGGRLRHGWV